MSEGKGAGGRVEGLRFPKIKEHILGGVPIIRTCFWGSILNSFIYSKAKDPKPYSPLKWIEYWVYEDLIIYYTQSHSLST